MHDVMCGSWVDLFGGEGWGYNARCGGGAATMHDAEGVGLQYKMWRGWGYNTWCGGVGLQYVMWRGGVWLQCIGEGVGLNGMMQSVCGACTTLPPQLQEFLRKGLLIKESTKKGASRHMFFLVRGEGGGGGGNLKFVSYVVSTYMHVYAVSPHPHNSIIVL